MAKVTCCQCGCQEDARSMHICGNCQSYVCVDCMADHRIGCCDENE